MTSARQFLTATLGEVRSSGFGGALKRLFMMKGEIKAGAVVGTDAFGNKYYESTVPKDGEQYAKDRWVEYKDIYNFDASTVPPEWHAWLHHMCDDAPTRVEPYKPFYDAGPMKNYTGTDKSYFPQGHFYTARSAYSSKTKAWQPQQSKS
mmetsp:Transcript_4545/g.7029  ORF Transcript_4545/g.7029 Transcript_4545/m.7029 type:complete len:149 (+) Transcript_4545:103-549(+)|eukprot:CAMPEP_0184332338 /NCGR_PEP_ID=MMETSP1089-20130417/1520_1 /TAXON_ID=38269 ORGANISM="Gloeochaete wittrockiana, Strain SAG46.84" /NCGR_SAMPLE_ID=MMETSP1089 /ASSEMBLY_ACC=CAM_ASM_000445 /LENGTH=148 /DNA_ID=CAMNT_0026655659 /DNA_START=95 /DNA_END=541 /DNA_ORIENTATION=+